MYLCHYPDIWFDYATWHAKNGSFDSAVEVYMRALKVLPDSDMLKYAYAEFEESRGAIQPAKKVYESLLASNGTAPSLALIQYIRFLRRSEGAEAARKYFLEARKSPNCTYHLYVAYAMMTFCLDKDPKVAHNIFEAGMKKFMHEPGYILEYTDFLCRLNDDRNVRALFERALSLLPPSESEEVWKRFSEFEQTYGDLSSMLKVEQRRKEALSRTSEDDPSLLDATLNDVISRYSFKNLCPCSPKDLDHLARQERITKNNTNRPENLTQVNGPLLGSSELAGPTSTVVYPDASKMVTHNPRQVNGPELPINSTPNNLASNTTAIGNKLTKAVNEILKSMSPTFVTFVAQLPAVEGPSPDVELVMSVLLQSNIQTGQPGKAASNHQASASSDHSGSSRNWSNPNVSARKRKESDKQEEDDLKSVQSRPMPKDVFRMRQIHRTRGGPTGSQQTGSATSGNTGSAFSGDQSASTE